MTITDPSLTLPEVYLPNIILKRCWLGQKTTPVSLEKPLAFSAWREVLHWPSWTKYDSFLQFCSSAGSDWPLDMVVLAVICHLLLLWRKLMTDLVLPHAYTWDSTALKLFLECEAVGWVWVLCSTLWGTGSYLWKTAVPKALFPLKLPSKPAWSECTWSWVCDPGDTLVFCLVLLALLAACSRCCAVGRRAAAASGAGDTASGSDSTHHWLCAASANREELWLHL